MHLSDTAIRNATAPIKPTKLFDGDGLYLLVNPNGSRWWRFKYRVAGRERLISFGTYPEVPLKAARERRQQARRLIQSGGDPGTQRKLEKTAQANGFESVAREWLNLQAASLDTRTLKKKTDRFECFLFPFVGKMPIGHIKAPDLLALLKRIEVRGKHETAHRVRSECGAVFRYAIASGRLENDPTTSLRGALAPVVVQNRPAITDPIRIGELLRAIDGYRGHEPTEFAFKLLPLTFVRPGELRLAEWPEFNLDKAEWRIPAEFPRFGPTRFPELRTT